MSTWGGGYVTDIEYGDGFYPAQTPRAMALATLFNGFEPADLSGPFAYCELGCGRGATALVVAAAHPEAEVHGIDFHPAHIAHARDQATAAGLRNAHFHEESFADLLGPGAPPMPMFDVITMHGVWSWISPELQDAILKFLDSRLKPGGLVYVSYNALPGWSQVAPLQKLIRQLAAEHPIRSDLAAEKAVKALLRLNDGGVIPDRLEDAVNRIRGVGNVALLGYVAHEYLNEHWQPLFHFEVAEAFGKAKLGYVAASELMRSFHNLVLSDEQRAVIGEAHSPELRETLRDMAADIWFRQDVFVRGARRMRADQREAVLRGLLLTPLRKPPEMLQIDKLDGTAWRPEPAVYGPVLQVLQSGPARVRDLLTMPGLPEGHVVGAVELVGVLVGLGLAAPRYPASAEARAACGRLNDLVGDHGDGRLTSSAAVAVAGLAGGLSLSPNDLLLFNALRRGESPSSGALARRFIDLCHAGGGHPIIEGRPVEDDAVAMEALSADYETRLQHIVPLWRMMELV